MSNRSQLILLGKRLGLLVLCYSICRLLFFAFNYTYFEKTGIAPFIGGIRFDASAILVTNVVFIVLSLIPFNIVSSHYYQMALKFIYLLVNVPLLILNCVDIEYFKFTQKRSTADFVDLFLLGDDVSTLLVQYLKDFWYLLIPIIALIWLLVKLYPEHNQKSRVDESWKLIGIKALALIFILGLAVLIARGGTQLKPISPLTASNYSLPQHIPLVLNSPFSVIYSWTKSNLKKLDYLQPEEVNSHFNAIKNYKDSVEFRNKNVVLIILESFSKELIGPKQKHKSLTPFLDSLKNHSLVFSQSFANGKKSIEALPSILASIPVLMSEPYITSNYSANFIEGLPNLLSKKGYYTSFFHGGKNGTMGFDRFAEAAGFKNYYGMDEYDNSEMYDKNWGIYDDAFFQFFGEKVSTQHEPFISCLFSLTSHHPYNIPEQYDSNFTEAGEKIHRTIQYTDYSMKKLFDQIKHEDWFENTIFVITADHTPDSHEPFYRTSLGNYSVPIVFYTPDENIVPSGVKNKIVQHIDIMPSLLDLMNYEDSFVAFGNSIFSEDSWSLNYVSPTFQFLLGDMLYLFNGSEITDVFDVSKDSLLVSSHSFDIEADESSLLKIQAIMQEFNRRMIENDLSIEH